MKQSAIPFSKLASFFFLACAAFLFFQGGDWWDETEHCHAAWLMGTQNLRPFRDFFQHHSPMIWDLLAVFYRLGGSGTGVLPFGRFLVVLCAGAVGAGIWMVARPREASDKLLVTTVSLFAFFSFAIGLETFFVIRPETPAAALGALAIAAWAYAQRKEGNRALYLAILAGALWGLAIFSSVRFSLASPIFLAFLDRGRNKKAYLHLGVAVLSSLLAFGAYAFLFWGGLKDYFFLLAYSAQVQKIGDFGALMTMYLGDSPLLFGPILVTLGLFGWSYLNVEETNQTRVLRHGLWCLVLLVANTWLSWPHNYPANYSAIIFYAAFAIADVLTRVPSERLSRLYFMTQLGMVWVILVIAQTLAWHSIKNDDMLSSYRLRTEVAAHLKPGETVLLPFFSHPIAAPDASFYTTYFLESTNRTCEAAQKFPELPPCDLFRDLKERKPRLIDFSTIKVAVDEKRQSSIMAYVSEHYKFWASRAYRLRYFDYYEQK